MAKSKSKSKSKAKSSITGTNGSSGSKIDGVSPELVSDDSFFTAALSMIPAKHYLPAEDLEPSHRFHNRKDKSAAAAPPASRADKQKALRAKLDPKQAKSIPQLLKERADKEAHEAATFKASLVKPHHSQAEADAIEDAEQDDKMHVVTNDAAAAASSSSTPVTLTDDREELKQRLHKQLEVLRAKRKARDDGSDDDDDDDTAHPKKRRRLSKDTKASSSTSSNNRKQQNKRQKKGAAQDGDDGDDGDNDVELEQQQQQHHYHAVDEQHDRTTKAQLSKILQQAQARAPPSSGSSKKEHQRDDEQHEPDDLQFGTFDLSGSKPVPSYLANRKRKESDFQILQKAEKERRLLQELKQTDRGKEVAKDLLFEKVLKKAKGEKVKDDVSKIKKTIKRKQSSKAKSQREWKDRINSLKERQDAKQRRREENIKKYRGKNKVKNVKPGAKGSSKKGGRPGFEGKKGGFLNK